MSAEQVTTPEAATAEPKPQTAPQWQVVLLDDDFHTYAYVIEMLGKIFGHAPERAYQMACEVDGSGRVVVYTGVYEQAEFKQQQVHAYGPDWRVPHCKGAMTAVLEPLA